MTVEIAHPTVIGSIGIRICYRLPPTNQVSRSCLYQWIFRLRKGIDESILPIKHLNMPDQVELSRSQRRVTNISSTNLEKDRFPETANEAGAHGARGYRFNFAVGEINQ